jgi:hypothetical protein
MDRFATKINVVQETSDCVILCSRIDERSRPGTINGLKSKAIDPIVSIAFFQLNVVRTDEKFIMRIAAAPAVYPMLHVPRRVERKHLIINLLLNQSVGNYESSGPTQAAK